MSGTLTSANSVVTMTVPGIFPSPVQLQNYAADRAWEAEAIAIAEAIMSVDGVLSGGRTPKPKPISFHLMANSDSIADFEEIYAQQESVGDIFRINMTIRIPGIGKVYTCSNGIMTNYKTLPNAATVLEEQDFQITFEQILPSSL
jgi:hypothetical protein